MGWPAFWMVRGRVDAVLAVLGFPGDGVREMPCRAERMSVSSRMFLGDAESSPVEESLMYPSLSKRTRHCIPPKVYLTMRW